MKSPFSLTAVYDSAMELNSSSFAAGRWEVAYHFLMSAFHCAQDLRDIAKLTDVGQRFRDQLRVIDDTVPSHRLSSPSAQAHGHRSIYDMGATTVDAALQRFDVQDRLAEHRRGR